MTGVLIRRGNWDTRHVQREDNVKTQGEDSQPQAKGRSLEQTLLSQPSEGTDSAHTLISDF